MLKMYMFFINALLASVSVLLPGCSGDEKPTFKNVSNMEKLTANDWNKLSEKKIFFGHRSVGSNIIDGLIELRNQRNSPAFNILETKDKSDFRPPVFAHAQIGENLYPKSKIDEFTRILENGLADSVDIAFMKLCFADINRHTDINELFEYYQTSINSLQEKYPNLKIIHCTVPLTPKRTGLKGIIRRFLLMDDNPYRHKYNQLMRSHYSDFELFDVAKMESTFPDNTANIYGYKKTPGLVPEYSSNGGHLNQRGKLLIANELLHFLLIIINS